MAELGRRKFLGAMAMAPMTAGAAVAEVQQKLAGVGLSGLASGLNPPTPGGAVAEGPTALRFFDFAKFALHRERDWREQAKSIACIDPDLASLHLPLATVFRMQRARNYERIKAEQEHWFKRRLKESSFVQWWD